MSVIEVERKRQITDVSELKTRLADAGYRDTGSTTEIDTYYSRSDVDFLATVECLRVRQRDAFAEITYKPASTAETHSDSDIIAKPEANVILAGPEQAAAANTLLNLLGMPRLCRVEKARTAFRHPHHDNVTVVIDHIIGVGSFAETEVIAPDATTAASLLEQVEAELGLAGHTVVALPYRDLVLQHHHEHPSNPS